MCCCDKDDNEKERSCCLHDLLKEIIALQNQLCVKKRSGANRAGKGERGCSGTHQSGIRS